jgi:hypothetical protein
VVLLLQDIVVVQLLKSFKKLLKKLPRGYDIDWAGISADEVSKGSSHLGISYLFGFCVLGLQHNTKVLFCLYP